MREARIRYDPLSQKLVPDATFTLVCGAPSLESALIDQMETLGLQHDHSSATLLLIDVPFGFALRTLPMLTHPRARVIVLTDNLSPEYVEDLWEIKPAGLLAGTGLDRTLLDALLVVSAGERYRRTRVNGSTLSIAERTALRYIACGWSDERIAEHLQFAKSEVAAIIERVKAKLDLHNRVQIAMYYWGIVEFCD
jgi:DNA-binding NarL/FixJ family response regulator